MATHKNEKQKFCKVVEEILDSGSLETEYCSVLSILNNQQATKNLHFVEEKDYEQVRNRTGINDNRRS